MKVYKIKVTPETMKYFDNFISSFTDRWSLQILDTTNIIVMKQELNELYHYMCNHSSVYQSIVKEFNIEIISSNDVKITYKNYNDDDIFVRLEI
jgi:hypothetical protein